MKCRLGREIKVGSLLNAGVNSGIVHDDDGILFVNSTPVEKLLAHCEVIEEKDNLYVGLVSAGKQPFLSAELSKHIKSNNNYTVYDNGLDLTLGREGINVTKVCRFFNCTVTPSTPAMIKKTDVKSAQQPKAPEHTGLSVGYYDVVIKAGTHTNPEHNQPMDIVVSCNDIIEALNMNYAQANVFKAVWRICAAIMGKTKKGNNTKYDAEKSVFFSKRMLKQETGK